MKGELQSRFDADFLEVGTEVLRAIAHPIRLTIIDVLHEKKRLSVTEIYELLGIEQAIASHHLRILKDKKVVIARRDGKKSFYSLCDDEFHIIVKTLEKLYAK